MKPIFLPLLSFSILSFTACNAQTNHKIASIPEASGISYCHNSNTLMVANDEGTFYEISPEGAILSKHKLGKYDLEGVVCEEDKIIFAVEDGALLEVNRKTLKTKLLKIKGQDFKFSKKAGIEGITKIKDLYYVSIQAKTEKDSKILVLKAGKNYAKVLETIEHGIIDSAGMQYHNKKLYIVSDKKDKLYLYNLKKNKIKKRIKLPKFAQEGITFGVNKDIYFADDDGAVFKYTLKELGL
jgi:nitrite reductase/ring-hydroxylating ferredoxin subunit